MLCIFCFSNIYAQSNVKGKLQGIHDKFEEEKRTKIDAKITEAINNAARNNKSKITEIRPIESNPDAYILSIDGKDYLFTRSNDRDNAKNRFVEKTTGDAVQWLKTNAKKISLHSGSTTPNWEYRKPEIKQKISDRCRVSKGKNPNYRAKSTPITSVNISPAVVQEREFPITPQIPGSYHDFGQKNQDIYQKALAARTSSAKEESGFDPNSKPVIFEQPSAPTMSNTIDIEKAERERLAALNPFEIEALDLKKKALEAEYAEISKTCNKSLEFDCLNKLKPIADELDAIAKRKDYREEWLNNVKNMTETELAAEEQKYQKLVEMASMSDFCYKDNESLQEKDLPAHLKEIKMDDGKLGKIMADANNNDAGFQCSLLYNTETGKYVLAFRGTEFGREFIKDFVIADIRGSIWQSKQTKLAISTVDQLIEEGKIRKEDLEVTGHSLGGGLAIEVAHKHDLTAYTFNPKGLSDATHEEIAKNNYNHKGIIHNVIASNDFLQSLQNGFSESAAPINVRPVGGFTILQEAYGTPTVSTASFEAHKISFVGRAIEQRCKDIEIRKKELK